MFYKIISSGKDGNCVIINDVMVDCGVPAADLKAYIWGVKYLLITHKHKDHVNELTLESIKLLCPHITIIGNQDVHDTFGVHVVIDHTKFGIRTPDYHFTGFELKHDVMNTGFTWKFEDKHIIFAVDTADLDNAPREKLDRYDYLFLESNYDALFTRDIEQWVTINERSPLTQYQRHLSKQEAQAFYNLYKRSDAAELIELHKSETFYDRHNSMFTEPVLTLENDRVIM